MKRWQQSALLAVFGLVCVFNAWGQNEAPANEKESTCEKFENSQWVRKHDQRIRSLISLQKPYVDGSLIFPVDVFDNSQLSNFWEDSLGHYLDDAQATLGKKIHSTISKTNNQNIPPIAERFLIAKRYSKYILEMESCAAISKSFLFTSNLKDAVRKKALNGTSTLTAANKISLGAAKYIVDFDPKDLSRSQRIHDEVNIILNNVPNAQLASFMAFVFKNHDTFVASVQDGVDQKYNQFFPTLENWANQKNRDAQVKRKEELEKRDKAQKESDKKAQYAASPDGQLDMAFNKFMTVEKCFKDREGFATGFISQSEYLESRMQVKFIQERFKPALKEAVDLKWKRLAQSFEFTAKPNLIVSDQLIQFACRGALSSLEAIFKEVNPTKGPAKSF